MITANNISLAGGGLDRQAHLRARAETELENAAARCVPFWRGRPLVSGGPDAVDLVYLAPDHPLLRSQGGERVFLGSVGAAPMFAQDLPGWNPNTTPDLDVGPGRTGDDVPIGTTPGVPAGSRFADLRGLITRLTPHAAEVAATAKGILEWHRTHRYCAACGAPSEMAEAGWQRRCPSCARRHFPRTDPVVIMLVTSGNSVLVGRSPGWPEGFYSLLAGFMEPGETVAGAVRREVMEESGVAIGAVRMLASQPWPFPASLMIGCAAQALSREITLDPVELEDGLWLSREEVLDVFSGIHPSIRAPRSGAVAHDILKMWLADQLD